MNIFNQIYTFAKELDVRSNRFSDWVGTKEMLKNGLIRNFSSASMHIYLSSVGNCQITNHSQSSKLKRIDFEIVATDSIASNIEGLKSRNNITAINLTIVI
jgi:hypothetical protein